MENTGRLKLVWCLCGSFCTLGRHIAVMSTLAKKYDIYPVISEKTASTDTRFGRAEDIIEQVSGICGRRPILTVKDAEPLGPVIKADIAVVAPCTGNTLAKIASGITDGAVTMAVKSTVRGGKPVLLSLATNDALGANLKNIGETAVRRGCFFVPMKQDDPTGKPFSLVADETRLPECIEAAVNGRQVRPLFLE